MYAIVCAFLWLGLPFPPGPDWPSSLYLATTSIMAAMLVRMFRRPTARVWYYAVVLSGVVIGAQLSKLPRFIAIIQGDVIDPAIVNPTGGVTLFEAPVVAAVVIALGTLPLLLQSIVALCCYRLRDLRRYPSHDAVGLAL